MESILNSLNLLSDVTRLRIVLLLDEEELSVAELQSILGMGQSRISSHLGKLKRAGIVSDRRSGKHIYYGTASRAGKSPSWRELVEVIRRRRAEIPECQSDRTALQVALSKRKDRAREYFNQLAGKFGRHYCPGRTWRGLSHLLLTLIPEITVADLGAGEGTLSQLLARNARKVVAVDNSEKMVEYGRKIARENHVDNLEYLLGDIEDPPIPSASIDLALFSQALHHAAKPDRALAAAHRILKPGGRLAVLDLLSHHVEEAHELYADLWLGFSETEMHALITGAGFHNVHVGVVAKDADNPQFQTLLATADKPRRNASEISS